MLQQLKHVTKRRSLFSSFLIHNNHPSSFSSSSSSSSSHNSHTVLRKINQNDVASSIKDWFKTLDSLITRIFQILSSKDSSSYNDNAAVDASLSALKLPRLDESFVLTVLHHGTAAAHVYPCLRFFHWVGRQPDFHHTRGTFSAISRILARAPSVEDLDEFLPSFRRRGPALWGSNRFYHAIRLVREFGNSGLVPLDHTYEVCIMDLVQGGRLNEALEFYRQKKEDEGYIPGLGSYNMLIYRLLRENRLIEVYDLFTDMSETDVPPNTATMNAVLCFFCKVGMADVALDLFKSRSEFMLSPNHMAYKYLILTLCWDGNAKEAFTVLKSSINHHYFPDRKTFTRLANVLCRECMIDEMKELLHLALERKIMPNASTYDNFIMALCRAGRVEDSYLIHGELKGASASRAYANMIKGFKELNRGHIAARLLVEMKEKGHKVTPALCRVVVCCLLQMDNSRSRFFSLFEMLSHNDRQHYIYDCFIDAAGHAKQAELAWNVFELMQRNGIQPTSSSQILMLKAYFKSGRTSDALNFFKYVWSRGLATKKLYNCLVVSLCKSKNPEPAYLLLKQMLRDGFHPSIECYENLVLALCLSKRYHEAVYLVNVYEKMGRRLTSSLGNILLSQSLSSLEVYNACVRLRGVKEEGETDWSMLSFVVGAFHDHRSVSHVEDLEKLIAKCFPLNVYTYNLLLTKACKSDDMEQACKLFERMRRRGFEPNWRTYTTMLDGFERHGMRDKAQRWFQESKRNYPTEEPE
ncbi:Pentatricopeptide repeat-containing protein [Arachis hypogaea]|nr:Pentatricopeptide repeat-containing protein [Arachis hypogaea]